MQRLPSLPPEIKNRCTQEGLNGEILASIPKSELEIKNRCTLALRRRSVGGTILLRCSEEWNRTRTSLPLRPLQAEPFSFAAAKNGIGRGPRCRYGRCRRNHSPLRRRRLESDAEDRRRHACCRRNYSSLTLQKLESDAEQRRLNDRSRRNYSSLTLRRLESGAYRCCGRNRCHSGGFLRRIMPPSWHPVPACTPRLCCRRAIHRCSSDGAVFT